MLSQWEKIVETLRKPRGFVELSFTNPENETYDYLLEDGFVSALSKHPDHVPVKQHVFPVTWEKREFGTYDDNFTYTENFKETPGFENATDPLFVGGCCNRTWNGIKYKKVFEWGFKRIQQGCPVPDGYKQSVYTGQRMEPIRAYDLECNTTREEVVKLRGRKYIIAETALIVGETKYDYALKLFNKDSDPSIVWITKDSLLVFISAKTGEKVVTIPGWYVYKRGLWDFLKQSS